MHKKKMYHKPARVTTLTPPGLKGQCVTTLSKGAALCAGHFPRRCVSPVAEYFLNIFLN